MADQKNVFPTKHMRPQKCEEEPAPVSEEIDEDEVGLAKTMVTEPPTAAAILTSLIQEELSCFNTMAISVEKTAVPGCMNTASEADDKDTPDEMM
jgi:hypothetical protein